MKPCVFICTVLLFISYGVSQENNFQTEKGPSEGKKFPKEWLGVWTGVMVITNRENEEMTVPLEMEITSIRGSDRLNWVTSFGDPDSQKNQPKVVKRYELVPVSGKSGQFRIDEKNGTILPARLVGNVLYSQFVVGGSSITARYEWDDGQLQFEIISTSKSPSKDEKRSVEPFNIDVIQRVKMNRTK